MPLAGYLRLASVPLVSAAIGLVCLHQAMLTGPNRSILPLAKNCFLPSRQKLSTDYTDGAIPMVDNFICISMPFFKDLIVDRLSAGITSLLLSVMGPAILHLCYTAVSPNRKSLLSGGWLVLFITALGQGLGFGMVAAIFGTLILTVGSYETYKRSAPSINPVPTPAGSIYLSNIAVLLAAGLGIAQLALDPEGWYSYNTRLVFLFYPILFIPVVIRSFLTTTIRDERAARIEVASWDAESVSYSFERTWSYYRKVAYVSAVLYWYGCNRIFRGWYYEGGKLNDSSYFAIWDALATLVFLFSLVALERTTFRCKAASHPLSGAPKPQLQVECERAIERAPAGHVWLETTVTGLLLASIVAGPGFAAGVWWASGEEEQGWKARKAWREAIAVEGKKE
ncbi:hypothetical protein IE53DRAFT_388943 [Violaceomyces palustris]|uniref:Uncharacterized protein n=1 Tax=Violaceomyces palustris TaxID=1673888 RepID=A0ACD0NST2_9BASI|nr:hypothetical protein IE53DRAFT_388943 [Violaceomyces palustris]